MLDEVVKHLKGPTTLEKVSFVLFDRPSLREFQEVWEEMVKRGMVGG